MAESQEIESTLSGSMGLPGVINIKRFVSVRLEETKNLKDAIENPKKTAMVFQQLPRHMRRRVMSYNIKRMPKRLREVHARLLDKCNAKVPGKRPSRKYRRRPKILRSEYARRQRSFMWLETHIWHAKRFHMTNRWGYRLPNFPNDKGFRACYRASEQHTLLQDISYFVCIELVGNTEEIFSKLAPMKSEGNGFSAIPYRCGAREGETLLINLTSDKPFGWVKFMWSPTDESPRKLWLWAHPGFYRQLYEFLKNQFASTEVTVNLLKDEFVRFKLIGPKSIAVAATCLSASTDTPWCVMESPVESVSVEHCVGTEQMETPVEEDLAGKLSIADDTEYQKDYFNKICNVQSHNELLLRSVIPAVVQISIPARKEAFRIREIDLSESVDEVCNRLGSVLWSAAGRKSVKEYMNSRPKRPTVPVIVIQNPNNERGYSGGIDLVAGSGCGMALWLALVHSGGRAGGLRETEYLELFSGKSPVLPLDSPAGAAEDMRISSQIAESYFRLPPAKRTNYTKLGIVCPFSSDWVRLSNEWDGPLIRVHFEALGRGSFPRSSVVCVPLPTDETGCKIVEPAKEDPNQELRKQTRKMHQEKLKQLAKARKKARFRKDEEKLSANSSEKEVKDYNDRIRELWVPEPTAIRSSCVREVGGFVSAGQHHPGKGHVAAVGYVTAPALALMNGRALLRAPKTSLYRWAEVTKL